jgi:hypothetical protein
VEECWEDIVRDLSVHENASQTMKLAPFMPNSLIYGVGGFFLI